MSKRQLEDDDPASIYAVTQQFCSEAFSRVTPEKIKQLSVQLSARKRAYVTPISEGFKSEEEVKSCAKRSLASQFEFDAAVTKLPPLREDSLNNLSEQQLEVIKLALPPTCNSHDKGSMPRHLVRVTAAAGTGKTTTLLHLALRCIDLGHSNLTYLTFSKASAKDAHGKIQDILSRRGEYCAINASTLHACAWRLLQEEDESDDDEDEEQQQDESDDDGESIFLNDNAFGALIGKKFNQQIEDHLSRAYDAIDATTLEQKKRTSRKKQLRDQAIFYLKKTFWTFCISKMSLADLKNDYHWARHYYPGKCNSYFFS